jgi:hypothetical protein
VDLTLWKMRALAELTCWLALASAEIVLEDGKRTYCSQNRHIALVLMAI